METVPYESDRFERFLIDQPTARQIRRFNQARCASNLSDCSRVRVGCLVTLGSRVLSVGFNTNRTHPLQQQLNAYRNFGDLWKTSPDKLHAEVLALLPLLNLDLDWPRVDLYVYRQRKDGTKGLARPCPACSQLIRKLGIRNVYYTSDTGFCHENF